jgi:uncharacterized protein (TIGR04141 family)
MRIASQGNFWVCVAELSLQSLGICTERVQLSRVTVAEAMETDFWQPQSLLEGLQLPPSPVGEIDGLSVASRKHIVAVLAEFRFATQFQKSIAEFLRQGKWFVSRLALEATLLHEWSAYRCLYAEVEHGDELFVLSSGKWYQVKSNFVDETNAAYAHIPNYEGTFPEFMDDSEGRYSNRLVESDPKRHVLMDQKMIPYGGGHSQVEFCDLLSSDVDLLHVKRYSQSSALSHLFAQGLVSGELFQMDASFREEVNKKLPRGRKLPNPKIRPKQGELRVVFAIISDRRGDLKLPFFSRLNLKHAARRLEAYGFRVAKAKIDVNEAFSKTARFRTRKSS